MRPGDGLILIVVLGGIALLAGDLATAGGVGDWAGANLPAIAQGFGGAMGAVGKVAWPILAVPFLAAVAGRFVALPPALWSVFERLIAVFDGISLTIGGAARWFALGLVVATAIIVIQRYVFGYASTKLQESVIYMHALLFLLASASALLSNAHVRVDILYAKATDRGKAWIDLIGVYLALMPMSALILWSSTGYMNSTWRILEQSRESDGLPFVFLLKTAIPLFALMMILQGVSMACRSALTIAGKEAPPTPKSGAEAEV